MRWWALRIAVVLALVAVTVMTLGEAAFAENLWEKLFGCNGVLPISCPGPPL